MNKIHYRRNILISIILSEAIIISAFIFSPVKFFRDEKILYDEQFIRFEEMPHTVQALPGQSQIPELPPIHISDQLEAFEILENVSLTSNVNSPKNNASTENSIQSNTHNLRSVPRQIYEVVPANGDKEFYGSLHLSLKINQKGRVVDHRVLSNSLDCTDCLNQIIKAAYKSKWEPALINGKNTDYWVVKSYIFN